MPRKITVVKIFTLDWERLKKIKASKGFPNYAETFGYVLQKFPEMIPTEPTKPVISGSASLIIDAEKLQNKQFVQLGEVKKP